MIVYDCKKNINWTELSYLMMRQKNKGQQGRRSRSLMTRNGNRITRCAEYPGMEKCSLSKEAWLPRGMRFL